MKMCKIERVVWIVAWVAVLGGCQTAPFQVQSTSSLDQALQSLQEAAQEAARANAEPPVQPRPIARAESAASLVPPTAASDEAQIDRFDVAAEGVPARAFYAGLVEDTIYSVVVHPALAGEVSLRLKQVTMVEVMQTMRDVFGHDYRRTGNIFHVSPDTLATEVFELDYLNVARGGASEVQVSAGKFSDSGDQQQPGVNNNGARSQQVVSTIVSTRSESDLWGEVAAGVRALIGADPDSHVEITPQVGLIVVTARPAALRAVRDYLERVRSRVNRQVILEAKIIEVTLNDGFQAGIDWQTFGDASGGTFAPQEVVLPDGSVALVGGSEHSVAGQLKAGVLDFFNPTNGAFTLQAATGDFAATLNLLATQGAVQVLSAPRIATVNNQKAVIKVGNDEFFVTDVSSNTVTAGSAINISDSPELTPFFSGIALDVTPQISANGEVVLHVHPTVSEVSEQLKEIGGEMVPLATSTIRESDTVVRARSGQIVVIGGLMQNAARDDNSRVPWLSRIPLFGRLFKQQSSSKLKRELVILLKPVVVEADTSQSLINASVSDLEQIRRLLSSREQNARQQER